MREAVVFVHGIWMTGAEMLLLRRRLSHCGFDCYNYRYQSMRRAPRENATHLNYYLQGKHLGLNRPGGFDFAK